MDLVTRTYHRIIQWNMFDVFANQGLLLLHNAALRIYGGPVFHGKFALLFSLFYFLLQITVAGLESTLSTWWKKCNYSLLGAIVLQQIIITIAMICIIYIGTAHHPFFQALQNPLLLHCCVYLIVIETIKKTLKSILILLKKYSHSVLIELGGFIIYLIGIWAWYIIIGFTLESSFFFLAFVSSVQVLGYTHLLSRSYLPQHLATVPLGSFTLFRIWAMIGHQTAQLFTGNFLIPCFATFCSISFLSAAKMMSLIAQFIIKFIQRTIGSTVLTTFAHTQHALDAQSIIAFIQTRMYRFIASFCLLCFIIAPFALKHSCSLSFFHACIMGVLLIMLTAIEGFYALFDRILIVLERPYINAIISVILLFILSVTFSYFNDQDALLIIILALLRIGALIALISSSLYILQSQYLALHKKGEVK